MSTLVSSVYNVQTGLFFSAHFLHPSRMLAAALAPWFIQSRTEWHQSVWWLSYGMDNRGIMSSLSLRARNPLFSETSKPAVGPMHSPVQWYRKLSPRTESSRSVTSANVYIALSLRMSAAVPYFPYMPLLVFRDSFILVLINIILNLWEYPAHISKQNTEPPKCC
jgi:hypothetical protein